MTVAVTGATGLLGSHVTELLVAAGERTRVLVEPGHDQAALQQAGVDVHVADIADRDGVARLVSGADRVIHCAARTGPWGLEAEYQRTNVRGLQTLIGACMAAGVRRVVHVSSVTVHGNDVGGAADESSPLREEPNPYSRSKLAGERLLARMIETEGAPVTIVRPGWIYGPRDAGSFARIARMIEHHQLFMIGSGANRLPLIFVRDAARGAILASHAPAADGRAYLLVNDEPVTQRDFICAIATHLGVPAPRRKIPYDLALMVSGVAEDVARLARRRQPPPVTRYGMQMLGGDNRFNIARAKRELGFSPEVGLAEGVRRSVEWYRATYGVSTAWSACA